MTGFLSDVVGFGGDGGLARLTITNRDAPGTRIVASFNPAEISRSRSVAWRPVEAADWAFADRDLVYGGPTPETLSVTLLFDTYETWTRTGLGSQLLAGVAPASLLPGASGRSVTDLTQGVVALTKEVRKTHRPPVCELSWGTAGTFFTGVLTGLEQTLTMFLTDGTPVRATLACTFMGLVEGDELHSADVHRTRVLRRGETLHDVAAQEYDDPALWRHIARANGIVDPMAVRPGAVLHVPRLTG